MTAGTVVPGYRTLNLLGEGGQGKVWKAVRESDDCVVALKVLELGSDAEFATKTQARVKREAHILKVRIHHPHVVQLVDYGPVPGTDSYTPLGRVYLAYEFILGAPLSQRLGQAQDTYRDFVATVTALADALDLLHRNDIVHRDVKPSNVMLRNNSITDPVLIDFTTARNEYDKTTTMKGGIGTYGYFAPECHSGKVVAASDQFSLAVVAAEFVARKQGAEEDDLQNYRRDAMLILAAFAPMKQVSQVLRQAFAKQPEDRFPTVSDFARALELALVADGVLDDQGTIGAALLAGVSGKLTKAKAGALLRELRAHIWKETDAGASRDGILRRKMLNRLLDRPVRSRADFEIAFAPELQRIPRAQLRFIDDIVAVTSRLAQSDRL